MPKATALRTTTAKVVKPVVKKAAPVAAKTPAKPQAAVKSAAGAAAKPAKAPAKPKPEAEAKDKAKKPKLVRDSFTMPEAEYAALGEVKKACLKAGIEVKKSELLRVGVALVRQLETGRLKEILAGLPMLKAGRPKKSK